MLNKPIVSDPTENYTQRSFDRRYWLRLLLFAVKVSATAALFLLIYFGWLQLEAFVTPKRQAEVGTPDQLNRPYEEIVLTARDGLKIAAWHITGTRPYAVILVHGIHANRRAVLPEARILAQAGYHLLMLDLRGHGQSEGNEATYGYREALDVQAALDYLEALPGIEQIGALGTSYGGAAVARAAGLDPRLRAIVIESSYSSLAEAIEDAFDDRSIFPAWTSPLFIFLAEQRLGVKISQVNSARSLAAAGDLAVAHQPAVMIIHGMNDHLFPVEHAYKLYDSAQEPKTLWIIEGLGHANPVIGREVEYKRRVVTFFEEAFDSHQ